MLFGLVGFIAGLIFDIQWLWMAGGIVIILNDILGIIGGFLKPLIPVILAIIGAIIIEPWYLGVMVASAIFALLDIPMNIKRISGWRPPGI
jgi:hypothetical protein